MYTCDSLIRITFLENNCLMSRKPDVFCTVNNYLTANRDCVQRKDARRTQH